MKSVKLDKLQAEIEAKDKIDLLKENEERNQFIESLKDNHSFQKYVIDGIIKLQLDKLTDIRNISVKDLSNPVEVGNLVFQATAARKILEKILSDLIN